MAERRWPGRFIVIEGIDGCGSTTQTRRLKERLERAAHQPVLETREPTSGPIGQLIRQLLQGNVTEPGTGTALRFDWATMALLFAADRVAHVQNEILPALHTGTTVISDRYDLSSLAYQSATSSRPGDPASSQTADKTLAWLRLVNAYAVRPDLTLVLNVPVEVAEARRRGRGGRAELFEVSELQRVLARIYADAGKLVRGDQVLQVDGQGEPAEVEERLVAAIRQAGLLTSGG